jgi:hypothetical protein
MVTKMETAAETEMETAAETETEMETEMATETATGTETVMATATVRFGDGNTRFESSRRRLRVQTEGHPEGLATTVIVVWATETTGNDGGQARWVQ